MENNKESAAIIGAGESCGISIEFGKMSTFKHNRPVRYRIEMTNGSVIEGVIPANTDFKVTPYPGDIVKLETFIEDIPRSPYPIE